MSGQQRYLDLGGGILLPLGLPLIALWNTKTRPQNVDVGTLGFNTQTQSLEYFNGHVWHKKSLINP